MKFGKQMFLNPVDSEDNGWVKFSIRPKSKDDAYGTGWIGHTITWQIADCSNVIYLDFDGWAFYKRDVTDVGSAKKSIAKIKERRKKLKAFVKAVNDTAEKVFQAMDEDEALINKILKENR